MDIGTLTGQIRIEDQLSGLLTSVANRVRSFATSFDSIIGGLAISVGVVATAITGLIASVIALGNRGAEVEDITSTFERFSGSVEVATETLDGMREAVRETMTDFELMKSANKLLAADVSLTSTQFKTLADAAFVLADQGLGSTAQMLDVVSQAMLTGRTRTLEMKIGKIDLRKAEEDFAESLGVTAKELNEAGKLEAKRIGILDALNERVAKAGDIQKDFGDIMLSAVVTIRNWGSALSRAVANSPVVMKALKDIGQGLLDVFGGTREASIRTIVGWVDKFAGAVSATVPYLVSAAKAAKSLFDIIANNLDVVESAVAGFIGYRLALIAAEVYFWAVNTSVVAMTASLVNATIAAKAFFSALIVPALVVALSMAVWEVIKAIRELYRAWQEGRSMWEFFAQRDEDNFVRRWLGLSTGIDKITESTAKLRRELEGVMRAGVGLSGLRQELEGVMKGLVGKPSTPVLDPNRFLNQAAAAEAAKKFKEEQDALFGRDLIERSQRYVALLGDVRKAEILSIDKKKEMSRVIVEAQDAYTRLGLIAPSVLREILIRTQELVPTTHAWVVIELKAAVANLTPFAATVEDLGVRSVPLLSASIHESRQGFVGYKEAIEDTSEVLDEAYEHLRELDKGLARSLGEGLVSSLQQLPGILQDAFTGGGGLAGALKAIFVNVGYQMGQVFAKAIVDSIALNIASGQGGGTSGKGFAGAAGLGALSGAGAMAAGASGGQAAGIAASTGLAAGISAYAAGATIGGSIALGAVTAGIGLAVVGAIALYRAKHMAEWEKLGKDIGRDYGVALSKEALKAMEESSKSIGRQATGILFLDEIIKAAGGVNASNLDNFTKKLHDVFSMIEMGKFSVQQASEVLDKTFGEILAANTDSMGHWSDAIQEIILLDQRMGTNSLAIRSAIQEQLISLVGYFNQIVGGTEQAMIGYAKLRVEVEDAQSVIDALREKQKSLDTVALKQGLLSIEATEEATKLIEERIQAEARLTEALENQFKAAEAAKQELADLSVIASGAFAAALAAGASFGSALQAAQPGLSALRQSFVDLGAEVEDPFVKFLFVQSAVLERAPQLLGSIDALAGSLVAMGNLNILQPGSFESFARTAFIAYTRLQGEIAAVGGTTQDALQPMQAFLHEAERAAKELGIPLDDNTQMLIDQSKELGIWKEAGPTAMEEMTSATKDLVTIMKELVEAILGLGPAATSSADEAAAAFANIVDNVNAGTDAVNTFEYGSSPGGLKDIEMLADRGAASISRLYEEAEALEQLYRSPSPVERDTARWSTMPVPFGDFGEGKDDRKIEQHFHITSTDAASLEQLVRRDIAPMLKESIRRNDEGIRTKMVQELRVR